jgi:hypothetical protein
MSGNDWAAVAVFLYAAWSFWFIAQGAGFRETGACARKPGTQDEHEEGR